jgi:hypothetical protein
MKTLPIASLRSRRSRALAGQIAEWFTGRQLVMVAETEETGPVAFAASFPYSDRACYSGIGEFSGLCKAGLSRPVPA